jgi:hypothetical protein
MHASSRKNEQHNNGSMQKKANKREQATKCSPLDNPQKRKQSQAVQELLAVEEKWRKRKHRDE